jgi:hypothetical protein
MHVVELFEDGSVQEVVGYREPSRCLSGEDLAHGTKLRGSTAADSSRDSPQHVIVERRRPQPQLVKLLQCKPIFPFPKLLLADGGVSPAFQQPILIDLGEGHAARTDRPMEEDTVQGQSDPSESCSAAPPSKKRGRAPDEASAAATPYAREESRRSRSREAHLDGVRASRQLSAMDPAAAPSDACSCGVKRTRPEPYPQSPIPSARRPRLGQPRGGDPQGRPDQHPTQHLGMPDSKHPTAASLPKESAAAPHLPSYSCAGRVAEPSSQSKRKREEWPALLSGSLQELAALRIEPSPNKLVRL